MIITVKRTKQVAQFEPVTIEWSQEMDEIDPIEATKSMLQEIDKQLGLYLGSTNVTEGDMDAFKRVLENTSQFKAASMEDFEKLSVFQKGIVNELKKAYKRSPEWKERATTTNIANEAGRAN